MTNTYKTTRSYQLERDLLIFRALAAGPAEKNYLHRVFFRHKDGTLASRQCVERRLKKLCDQGYIISDKYYSIHARSWTQIYVLSSRGVSDVCTKYGMERDFVRKGLPAPHKLNHELHLSMIIRTIWREADQNKYKLISLFDDTEIKRRLTPAKGTYYPDLFISFDRADGVRQRFYLELDCGNKSRSYWLAKIASWDYHVLYVTLNRLRLDLMKSYVQQIKLSHTIAFCVANDLLKGGLSQTRWDLMPDNAVMTLIT